MTLGNTEIQTVMEFQFELHGIRIKVKSDDKGIQTFKEDRTILKL